MREIIANNRITINLTSGIIWKCLGHATTHFEFLGHGSPMAVIGYSMFILALLTSFCLPLCVVSWVSIKHALKNSWFYWLHPGSDVPRHLLLGGGVVTNWPTIVTKQEKELTENTLSNSLEVRPIFDQLSYKFEDVGAAMAPHTPSAHPCNQGRS